MTPLAQRYRRNLRKMQLRSWLPSMFADRSFVLGAGWHRFKRAAPCPPETISAFETAWRISLPAAYSSVLQLVGNGCAGPFFGLSSLAEWCQPYEESDVATDLLQQPFHPEGTRTGGLVPGALRVCNAGCEHYYLLIVSGPFRGQVWHDADIDRRGVIQLSSTDGEPLIFEAWITNWLDSLSMQHKPAASGDLFWQSASFPGHAIAQELSVSAPDTVVVDQLPCPACTRLLLSQLSPSPRVIVPALTTDSLDNPKRIAVLAAQRRVSAVPRQLVL